MASLKMKFCVTAAYLQRETTRPNITLERLDEKNPDGIGSHFRYRFVSRADVLRVIQLVNHNAAAGGYHGLSQSDIANILTLYPDANNAA